MVPHTFPTTYLTPNGTTQMVVYFLTDVTGLERWVDYIPTQYSNSTVYNSFDGAMLFDVLNDVTGLQAWIDYIPVYDDENATEPWMVNEDGFIPGTVVGI